MIITVNLQIFAIAIIFILTKQIKIYGILMLFTLLHEFAHMFMGILLKLKPKELKINPFGISILFETYERSKKKEVLVALSGPLFNIAIAILFYFLHIDSELKEIIIYSNILIGMFNLVPIYPLDGGRILKAILKKTHNFQETEKFINRTSNALVIILTAMSSVLVLIYRNIGILLVLAYLWGLTIRENKRYKLKERMYKILQNSTEKNRQHYLLTNQRKDYDKI